MFCPVSHENDLRSLLVKFLRILCQNADEPLIVLIRSEQRGAYGHCLKGSLIGTHLLHHGVEFLTAHDMGGLYQNPFYALI